VVHMDICKLFDDLKYFKIDFHTTVEPEEIGRIKMILHDSFDETKKSTLTPPIIVKDEIQIDCDHSKHFAVMHLNCKDQKGLLAYLINLFDSLGIDIATAKIHTIKSRVKDLFLIEKNGNFCHNVEMIIDKLTGMK
ncbi:MAG: hypothetical protein RL113_1107, partial [Pseudomonadota bacterium]